MVVVVIVCMGLLVTVLSVGVVRLRAAHNRDHVDHSEVECNWEGAPNITVNPLEVGNIRKNISICKNWTLLNFILENHNWVDINKSCDGKQARNFSPNKNASAPTQLRRVLFFSCMARL